jgi:hypothetical protein
VGSTQLDRDEARVIERSEVLRLANEFGLEARIVEKDYILGWILAGIYRDPLLAGAWVFKGGTCLKKCFFETYRFSEDLDFTVTDAAQLEAAFLESRFLELSNWLYDSAGIELPPDQRRFDIYDNKRGGKCCEARIGYRGPIAPRGGDLPRIKLDLTADEILVLPTVTRSVGHVFSDAPGEGITARCYAFEEVFGEKIRALGERSRPRDLYDVINLFRNGEFRAAGGSYSGCCATEMHLQEHCFPKNRSFSRVSRRAGCRMGKHVGSSATRSAASGVFLGRAARILWLARWCASACSHGSVSLGPRRSSSEATRRGFPVAGQKHAIYRCH